MGRAVRSTRVRSATQQLVAVESMSTACPAVSLRAMQDSRAMEGEALLFGTSAVINAGPRQRVLPVVIGTNQKRITATAEKEQAGSVSGMSASCGDRLVYVDAVQGSQKRT